MPEKVLQSLEGVSETLLMTLYVRARESQRPDAMIKDDKAVAMVNQIDCDFSRLRMQRHDEVAIIMRMNKFDSHVRDFLRVAQMRSWFISVAGWIPVSSAWTTGASNGSIWICPM